MVGHKVLYRHPVFHDEGSTTKTSMMSLTRQCRRSKGWRSFGPMNVILIKRVHNVFLPGRGLIMFKYDSRKLENFP